MALRHPSVGLALGSGGARGFAHIGVLQAMAEYGLEINAWAGSSMGSIIASLAAAGVDAKTMASLAIGLRRRHFIDLHVPKMGFIAGERIRDFVKLLTREQRIEDLSSPLAIVATDIETGDRVVFRSGPISDAVRASISVPGVFVPYRIGNRLFVDGGVVDRVPIRAARDLGVDLVIAVDVGLHDTLPPVRSIFDVILQSIDIMDRELARTRSTEADMIIRPQVGHISSTSFTNVEDCIEAGRQATFEALSTFESSIEGWKRGKPFGYFESQAQ